MKATLASYRFRTDRLTCLLRRHLVHVMVFVFAASCSATGTSNSDIELAPTKEHRDATAAIYQLMRRYHYKKVDVDDELSEQIFERYLDTLDPQKSFLLASDIQEFSEFRLEFDDSIRRARLQPVFDVFNRFRSRMVDRADYAKGLLKSDFDFSKDETYIFNREDEPWLESTQAMNEYWRKRVKNDVLSLRLTEMEQDKIVETLEQRYDRMAERVTQLKPNDVFQNFINAYTLSVEPHTSYFSPRNSEEFRIRMSLSLEGIGAALATEGEYTVIRRLITGGPAAMSEQLSVGDRIVGVGEDGETVVDVVSWAISDVVDRIRGPKGSTVNLNILPEAAPPGSTPELISLVRDEIKLEEQAAKSSTVETSINGQAMRFGVIDLPTFYQDNEARVQGRADYRSTTRDVERLLEEFKQSEAGIDGVILDLRGNGGGSLLEATTLTGLFIETGPVVQIVNSRDETRQEVDTDPSIAYDGPLAVLVDRNSASASEIFAAAMQDYGRGVVLGEPTFGKGTVQSVVPLDREAKLGQLKVTVAKFFRVNGEGTQFRGVVPDIVFPTAVDSDSQGERGLDNALAWARVSATDFEKWNNSGFDLSGAVAQHESRYRANESFTVLLEELSSQNELRDQREVSLLESERRAELEDNEEGREERLELLRRAFGAAAADGEDSDTPDVILEEAANVLGDIVATDS